MTDAIWARIASGKTGHTSGYYHLFIDGEPQCVGRHKQCSDHPGMKQYTVTPLNQKVCGNCQKVLRGERRGRASDAILKVTRRSLLDSTQS